MDESDLIRQRPVLAFVLVGVVGAVTYAPISHVMRGTVVPLEVVFFAVVFAVVYVTFAFYSETIEGYLGLE